MRYIFFCLSLSLALNASAFKPGDGNLELIDFTVTQNLNKIDIRWSTSAIKTGGPYFCIEKSKDGKNFTKVVDMPATENMSSYADYFEVDYQPYAGVSYYRVKQVDPEGNFRYSQIVTLKIEEPTKVEGYEAEAGVNPEEFRKMEVQDADDVLLVIRDRDGNDYVTKASVTTNNDSSTLNLAAPVTAGTYQVVGSSNERLHSVNVFVK
ncbi:MAG: hypothetical protein ACXVC6_13930 [Bacteroidia bacterium]